VSDVSITILNDDATPMIENLRRLAEVDIMRERMADVCATMTATHIRALGPNKKGWPTTGFYTEVARNGVSHELREGGFAVLIDHPEKPGAMRQRFWGGPIRMKDKLLTIPARAEFYGHGATEFTNLRYVQFKSGARALVVGKGGVGRVDFATGMERSVRGAGARARAMVAYWLVEEVNQEGDEGVIPTNDQYADACEFVLLQAVERLK